MQKEEKLSDLLTVRLISQEKLLQINAEMTYQQVINFLGSTLDVGSATMTFRYEIKGAGILDIRFFDWQEKIGKSGKNLLEEITAGHHKDD